LYCHPHTEGFHVTDIDAFIQLGNHKVVWDSIQASAHPASEAQIHAALLKYLATMKAHALAVIEATNDAIASVSEVMALTEQITEKEFAGQPERPFALNERHELEMGFIEAMDTAYASHACTGIEHPSLMLMMRTLKWTFDCFWLLDKMKHGDMNNDLSPVAVNASCISLHKEAHFMMLAVDEVLETEALNAAAYAGAAMKSFIYSSIRFWQKTVPLRILSFPPNVLQAKSYSLAVADALKNMARRQMHIPTVFAVPKAKTGAESETESSGGPNYMKFYEEKKREAAEVAAAAPAPVQPTVPTTNKPPPPPLAPPLAPAHAYPLNP